MLSVTTESKLILGSDRKKVAQKVLVEYLFSNHGMAMIQKRKVKDIFTILNDKGLHTRPATELVRCASSFKSTITLNYQDLVVNAKSLLGILMLAAARGAKIHIEAEGDDAQDAISAILHLAKERFNISY